MTRILSLLLAFSAILLGQTNFNNPPPPPPTSGSGIAVGGDGSATYNFWVVAKYTGGDSLPYGPIVVSNAPSPGSLSLFQFVRVNWGAVAGATGYDLLRTPTSERPTGACNCVVSANQVGTQFDLVTASVSPYTVNPAGSTYARIFLESYAYTSPRLRQDVNGVESDIGAGGGGSGSLTDLLDVTISGVSTGQFLRKSTGDWVNAAIAQSDVTGLPAALSALAPIASPTFTGNPAAPTASPGTNTTQLATTAFVTAAVAAGGGGSISAPHIKTVTAVTTDTILASTHGMGTTPVAFCFDNASPNPNQVSCGAPKLASNGDLSFTFSPAFTGTIRVYAQFATGGGGGNYQSIRVDSGTAVTGRSRINFISGPGMAVTATDDSGNNETDVEISAIPDVVTIGGTQTLTNKSLTSPALTGIPTTPTASPGTNTTQVASTAFVTAAVAAGGGGATDLNGLSDVVITSSASGDTLVHNGSNYVNRPLVVADISGAAPTASPALTGSPTAPTPAMSSNSTAIATTAWVLTRNVAPELGFSCTDEFLGTALSASLPIGSCGWNTAASGTSAAATLSNAEAGVPGLVNLTTGTTTTGTATLSSRNLSILFAGSVGYTFAGRIRIATLSDGTDTFSSVVGFIDGAAGSVVDGCFLSYSHGVNGGRFQANCVSNSTSTTADSGITVVAGTWYSLRVEVNAAASSAEFFINGTSAGTITTNIPSGAGRQTGSGVSITKSAGTSARTTDIDYLALQIRR